MAAPRQLLALLPLRSGAVPPCCCCCWPAVAPAWPPFTSVCSVLTPGSGGALGSASSSTLSVRPLARRRGLPAAAAAAFCATPPGPVAGRCRGSSELAGGSGHEGGVKIRVTVVRKAELQGAGTCSGVEGGHEGQQATSRARCGSRAPWQSSLRGSWTALMQ